MAFPSPGLNFAVDVILPPPFLPFLARRRRLSLRIHEGKKKRSEGREAAVAETSGFFCLQVRMEKEHLFPCVHQVLLKINDACLRKEGLCNLPVGAHSVCTNYVWPTGWLPQCPE